MTGGPRVIDLSVPTGPGPGEPIPVEIEYQRHAQTAPLVAGIFGATVEDLEAGDGDGAGGPGLLGAGGAGKEGSGQGGDGSQDVSAAHCSLPGVACRRPCGRSAAGRLVPGPRGDDAAGARREGRRPPPQLSSSLSQ